MRSTSFGFQWDNIGFPRVFQTFSYIFIQRTAQFRPEKCPWTKVGFNFKLVSSYFKIVSLHFIFVSLIFVVVSILFVLTCRRIVNRKINFVLCHSYSHLCYPISSTFHSHVKELFEPSLATKQTNKNKTKTKTGFCSFQKIFFFFFFLWNRSYFTVK